MAWPTKTNFVPGDVLGSAEMNNIGTNLNIFNPTSATNGQVLTANGAGSASYVTPAASGGFTLITSVSLTTDPTTISSIPNTYKHLMWVWRNASGNANNTVSLQANSISGLDHYYLYASYGATWTANRGLPIISYTNATPSSGTVTGWIYNYAGSSFKTFSYQQADNWVSGSNAWIVGFGSITSTAAISSLTLDGNGMTTLAGTFLLYGVN